MIFDIIKLCFSLLTLVMIIIALCYQYKTRKFIEESRRVREENINQIQDQIINQSTNQRNIEQSIGRPQREMREEVRTSAIMDMDKFKIETKEEKPKVSKYKFINNE